MNTERPENDDSTGASGDVPEDAREEKGAVGSGEAETGAEDEVRGEAEEDRTEVAAEAPRDPAKAEAEADGEPETPSTASETDAAADTGATADADATPAGTGDEKPSAAARTVADAPTSATEPLASATEAPASPGDDAELTPLAHGEPSAGAPGRRRSPAIIASVAAAVLLVGGGGAFLAANASGGSGGGTESGAPGGGGTPPPIALDGYSEASPSGGTNGIAPGEPNPYGQSFKVDGKLPDGPDSAPVYWAKGEVTKEEVAGLAKALGVDGAPVAEGEAWQVGPAKAGEGPTLHVDRKAPGAWTFTRFTPGTDNCKGGAAVCMKDPMSPAADPVSVEAAKKAAAPVLKAVGQDDAKVDASQVMGAQRVVNADPVVGGLPTNGWTTALTIGLQGEIVGGSGQLDAPVKGDTYPVLGARKTLELLSTTPGAAHRGVSSEAPATESTTVEGAVFGLASHTSRGQQTLLPSWFFEVRAPGSDEVATVTYPALDPKYLTSTITSEPSGQPSPRPSGPGDEATGAPRDVKVDGYTAEGKELTVSFTGGVCADYRTTAKESGDKVTVTVTETPYPDKVCIMIAKVYHQTVQLDEPLGDRKVVGTGGKAVPLEKPGARLPETSAR
ncbi:hypothetical protein [Streptomyces griseus]|uniref:hypothetical protein n=1 Tax=Streptomyces griseus TaxID=1911 RepID=UPI00056871DD|nr:hypothetical protein [Streptomyces griseus]